MICSSPPRVTPRRDERHAHSFAAANIYLTPWLSAAQHDALFFAAAAIRRLLFAAAAICAPLAVSPFCASD